MRLLSASIREGEQIPKRFTCDGKDQQLSPVFRDE
jgi:hypothetical protein